MYGYPPSPAVEAARPPPPLSPADKIPTNKEQELTTISALNTRLRSLLDKDKKENLELEKKKNVAKEASAKAKEDLDILSWTFNQACGDMQVQKETWSSTEADLIVQQLTSADKSKLLNYLRTQKNEFGTNLAEMVAKKQQKLSTLDVELRDVASYKPGLAKKIAELTETSHNTADSLKKKMVLCARLEVAIRELHHRKRVELYHEQKWAERCGPYDGQDPSTYATNKEVEQIKYREAELELRFKKIYEDTVAQMIEQSQQDQNNVAEKKRQSDAEKQSLEAQTKELRSKRIQLVNEISNMEGELHKSNKEIQGLEGEIAELERQIPLLEQAMGEALDKLKAVEVEMKSYAAKAETRDKHCALLRATLKEKQDQAAKAKVEEDNKINELKHRLNEKRQRIEEANIGLFPEISKYRGLVDVVEVKLTPQAKKQKRT